MKYVLAMTAIALLGCTSTHHNPNSGTGKSEPRVWDRKPTSMKEVTVSSAEELLKNIRSNVEITLKPGTYNLTEALKSVSEKHPHVHTGMAHDGIELQIKNVENLTIRSDGNGNPRLVAVPKYAAVMNFMNSNNITISGLLIGHDDPGYCEGSVLEFSNIRLFVFLDALFTMTGKKMKDKMKKKNL